MTCGTTSSRVFGTLSPPIWLVALVLAALAPACARALQVALERRLRRRTLDTIAQAWPPLSDGAASETAGERSAFAASEATRPRLD
jgi:hypothetical protein